MQWPISDSSYDIFPFRRRFDNSVHRSRRHTTIALKLLAMPDSFFYNYPFWKLSVFFVIYPFLPSVSFFFLRNSTQTALCYYSKLNGSSFFFYEDFWILMYHSSDRRFCSFKIEMRLDLSAKFDQVWFFSKNCPFIYLG